MEAWRQASSTGSYEEREKKKAERKKREEKGEVWLMESEEVESEERLELES